KVRYDIRVLYYFALLYLSYMKHRDSHGAYEILDHGLVQCVSSLAWDEPKLYESCNALFRHFCRYFAGSIQFVFTDFSEDDILVDRILNRKSEVRLKHFSPQEAKRVLQMQRRLFAQAAASLQKDFSILQIDSSADVSDNTARICQQLDRQG
ncbi:MAG TPA: hypothetical protein DDY98_08765, partial [Ruminococcaceae bacterium]|nr:hypothetical protein [Oscillospiraceae bacterium]